jgi:phosphatidylinositol glycan class B
MGNPNSKLPHSIPRACLAFFIGGLSCSIRFTSLAAFVPIGILLSIQKVSRSALSVLVYLICVCAVYGFSGIAATLALDRHMYGFPVFPALGNIDFNVLQGKQP